MPAEILILFPLGIPWSLCRYNAPFHSHNMPKQESGALTLCIWPVLSCIADSTGAEYQMGARAIANFIFNIWLSCSQLTCCSYLHLATLAAWLQSDSSHCLSPSASSVSSVSTALSGCQQQQQQQQLPLWPPSLTLIRQRRCLLLWLHHNAFSRFSNF